jgi:hypothetical protein
MVSRYHLLRSMPVLPLFLGLHGCHHAAWLLWSCAHCSYLHRCAVLTGLLGLPTGAAVGGPHLSHYTEGKKQEVRTRLITQDADHDMPHGHHAVRPNLQLPPAACADRSSMQEAHLCQVSTVWHVPLRMPHKSAVGLGAQCCCACMLPAGAYWPGRCIAEAHGG